VTPKATTRALLVRHGETEWSSSGRHTGRTDLPLTPGGETEARALAPRLSGLAFSLVLTSPLARARRTCVLTGLGASAEEDPDLTEWDYGDYEGERSQAITARRPGWSLFRDGCPGGESPAQVAARADRLIARVCATPGDVALFSHGQFSCVLAARWIGSPPLDAQHFQLRTGSLSILGFDPHHPQIAVIASWNARPGDFDQ
jgi:probable phosphoglycerate mutase